MSRRTTGSGFGVQPGKEPVFMDLVEALKALPGVGPRAAQRLAFHLLNRDRAAAQRLGESLLASLAVMGNCQRCNTLTQHPICELCLDEQRDAGTLCVVETPADLHAIEQTGMYNGLYFVLLERCSPLSAVVPADLPIQRLVDRIGDGLVKEVILATSATNEGEATAFWVREQVKAAGLIISQLARGVPMGAELEYTDPGTVARALMDRRQDF